MSEEQPPVSGTDLGSPFLVAACYEVFLGREIEVLAVAEERGRWSVGRIVRSFLTCEEFEEGIVLPLQIKGPFEARRFKGPLSDRHRLWAAEQLPLSAAGVEAAWQAAGWRAFLAALLSDERLMGEAGLSPIPDIPRYDDDWLDASMAAEPGAPVTRISILGASRTGHAAG